MDLTFISYIFYITVYLIALLLIIRVLEIKRAPVAALAWILAIIFLPYFGALIFLLFGNNHIERPLARKKREREDFRGRKPSTWKVTDFESPRDMKEWMPLVNLMSRVSGFAPTTGNNIELYTDGIEGYRSMFEAIDEAERFICFQTYIFRNDHIGEKFISHLAEKANSGVKVRLLYDAIGSQWLKKSMLVPLTKAGGMAVPFLPVNILRRKFQINLRNHRKIMVIDGKVGFTGGLNVGKEHVGENPRYGSWRDTHLRLEGPSVRGLAYVFAEDWHFATGEDLHGELETESPVKSGDHEIQVISGGPDQHINPIKEWYYTVAARARKRLWITTPYFIPDETMIDGLRMASLMGVDVRLLTQGTPPDQWITYMAARYYWQDMLEAGVRIWQYGEGMLHSKVILVDGIMASVGTANFDNRSLKLDFEVNCLIYSVEVIEDLEEQFRKDLGASREVSFKEFQKRSILKQAAENGCRLFSPLL